MVAFSPSGGGGGGGGTGRCFPFGPRGGRASANAK